MFSTQYTDCDTDKDTEYIKPITVNADIFAWLIFRVWQLKNIFAGC